MTTAGTDIVLVFPGQHRVQLGGALLHLPLSLLSLAAWLRERSPALGDRIHILDMHVRELTGGDFRSARIVGISAMTGHQIRYGLEAARLAREASPDAVIVWGGVHPSLLPEQTARHELVDAVIVGEGEETFREVVETVFAGGEIAGIPGTCVAGDDGVAVMGDARPFIDLNAAPLPAYDLVEMDRYQGIEHQFDYQSSRGCPFRCGFCYNTVFCGRKWRAKSAGKVLDELEHLCSTYRIKHVATVDDEFYIDRRRAGEIIRGLVERGIDCDLITSCRLDIVRKFPPDMFRAMREAGFTQIFFGAESGSNDILAAIGKDITDEDIIEGARMVAEAGMRPVLSFMSGFPDETFEQFGGTLDLIERLWSLHPLVTVNGIFPFNAYPGTRLFERARELAISMPESLDEWGAWTFQYEPDNPWLDDTKKRWMEIAFYIVRFRYYLARYSDRYGNGIRAGLIGLALLPLRFSAHVRWRRRWFGFAPEWRIFAWLVRKTFGYL